MQTKQVRLPRETLPVKSKCSTAEKQHKWWDHSNAAHTPHRVVALSDVRMVSETRGTKRNGPFGEHQDRTLSLTGTHLTQRKPNSTIQNLLGIVKAFHRMEGTSRSFCLTLNLEVKLTDTTHSTFSESRDREKHCRYCHVGGGQGCLDEPQQKRVKTCYKEARTTSPAVQRTTTTGGHEVRPRLSLSTIETQFKRTRALYMGVWFAGSAPCRVRQQRLRILSFCLDFFAHLR